VAAADTPRRIGEPLFAFALGGAVLFAAYALSAPLRAPPLVVDAATRAALVAEFEALAGRPALAVDIERLLQRHIADELLFRDALDRGVHLDDAEVRKVLVAAMRREAAGLLPDPTDEQLVDHYARHAGDYVGEDSVDFTQVYFAQAPADPSGLLERLRRGETIAGEAFVHGSDFPDYGRSMLRGLFGVAFVEALWRLPVGDWSGPIASSRGWHFVRLDARREGRRLPFATVRGQVEQDFLSAQIEAAVARRVAYLRQRHEVRIDP
jgi:peptidyl-prolyl cis-trans isomerase C